MTNCPKGADAGKEPGGQPFDRVSWERAFTLLCGGEGNKRVGLSAAVGFLYMNGWDLEDPNETLHPLMEDVAQGKLEKLQLAGIFERMARKLSR